MLPVTVNGEGRAYTTTRTLSSVLLPEPGMGKRAGVLVDPWLDEAGNVGVRFGGPHGLGEVERVSPNDVEEWR